MVCVCLFWGFLLVSALLSYFVNYKQIVLSADQKEYKIRYSYKAAMLVKILCQLLAISICLMDIYGG